MLDRDRHYVDVNQQAAELLQSRKYFDLTESSIFFHLSCVN